MTNVVISICVAVWRRNGMAAYHQPISMAAGVIAAYLANVKIMTAISKAGVASWEKENNINGVSNVMASQQQHHGESVANGSS